MANPLTPTTITDKNGRVTTVHKKQDAGSSSKSLSMPAPSLAPSQSRTVAGTPLDAPTPMTEAEEVLFGAWRKEKARQANLNSRAVDACLAELDREAASIAWRILKTGKVNHFTLSNIIQSEQLQRHAFNKRGYDPRVLRSQLRLLERVSEEYPDIAGSAGVTLSEIIPGSMSGYGYAPKVEDRINVKSIDTKEELDAIAAVAAFIANAMNEDRYDQFKDDDFKCDGATVYSAMWMKNHRLKAYILEDVEALPSIIRYVNEHDVGISAKDTREIIQYVAESRELGALNDGWL